MTKQVFDNGMVAHVWAQQTQSEGRSNNGNFWFEGDTIFSYRTPVARIVQGALRRVALITNETYSITTSSKHMPAIHRAVDYGRGDILAFGVPSIGAAGGRLSGSNVVDHVANLNHFTDAYTAEKARLKRVRDVYGSIRENLNRRADAARDYADAFALDVTDAFNVEGDAAEIEAHRAARDAKNADPATVARREKERTRRAERKAEAECRAAEIARMNAAEKIAAWKAGEYVSLRYGENTDENGGALLRIKGDNLETSLNATVPLAHAVKVFRFVKLCRERGEAWQRNGKTVRVGHFQVDSIDAQGNFRAGCHKINWPEVEAAARAAGVVDSDASADALEASAHA